MRDDLTKLMVRLPKEAKNFVEAEASKYGSSMNSEIVRCVVERMDRVASASGIPVSAGK